MPTISTSANARSVDRLGAALLAVPALLTLVLILHHPVLHARPGVANLAVEVQAVAGMDRLVHGGIIAMMALQALGFYLFSARLGWRRPAVAAGFMAYGAGVLLMIVPSTLDGFVTPDLFAACLTAPPSCAAGEAGAVRLVAVMIQDFSKTALMAMSAGTAAWAIALVSRGDGAGRAVGIVGALCATTTGATLMFSDVTLKPDNLAGMMASQVVWSLAAAALLIVGQAGRS